MDVSDIRYLQISYVIMEENEPERYSMSHYQFQSLIISGLSGCGFAIHSYDEGDNLFTINRKVLIYFPDFSQQEKKSTSFLKKHLKCCVLPIKVGYVIQNKSGACIIRIELPDLYT